MKILKEDTKENIEKLATAILDGQVIVIPTETVYALSCNAYNEASCKKIYEIKKRPTDKHLIVLVSSYEMLNKIIEPPTILEQKIMNKFWPGPLTIIFNKKKNSSIAKFIAEEQIAIRMTSHDLVRKIIEKANVPIVAPSANISQKETGTKIATIKKDLKDVDYVFDDGDISSSVTSTIIKVEEDKIKVLREGKITKEELNNINLEDIK